MIRFIEMTGIYLDETKSFGFYDTVRDQFLNIGGDQCYDSIDEFVENKPYIKEDLFNRLYNLIPDNWRANNEIIMG